MLDMTLADLQDDWQYEVFRAKREREIAEQGIRAAITYERGLEKRREIGRNIITVILGLADITVIVGLLLDTFFI